MSVSSTGVAEALQQSTIDLTVINETTTLQLQNIASNLGTFTAEYENAYYVARKNNSEAFMGREFLTEKMNLMFKEYTERCNINVRQLFEDYKKTDPCLF